QQSGGKLASAFSTTRTGHAAVSKREDTAKIQLSSCSSPQPFQPGTSSGDPRNLQTETLGRVRLSGGGSPAPRQAAREARSQGPRTRRSRDADQPEAHAALYLGCI